MDSSKKSFGISGSTLKLIAVAAMIIDHIGAFMINSGAYPVLYEVMRGIGRIAFPIFCFLLIEGLHHTKNIGKYMLRLFVFALISEAPYDLARWAGVMKSFNGKGVLNSEMLLSHQNIFFTLLLGLITVWLLSRLEKKYILCGVAVLIACVAAIIIKCDYSYKGVLMVVLFYYAAEYKMLGYTLIGALNIYMKQPAGILALALVNLYNGKRGLGLKYVMYAVYPVHLAVIYIVVRWL